MLMMPTSLASKSTMSTSTCGPFSLPPMTLIIYTTLLLLTVLHWNTRPVSAQSYQRYSEYNKDNSARGSGTMSNSVRGERQCGQCCAGPAGAQGIPGIPGQLGERGRDGRPGLKGEGGGPGPKGDKGDHGQTGDIGFKGHRGRKGNKGECGLQGGTGEPGVEGPMGPPGAQGSPGKRGPKGEQPARVAFTVTRSKRLGPVPQKTPIVFDKVHLNLGDSFDIYSSHFICKVNGTYLFMVHVLSMENETAYGWIMLNNDHQMAFHGDAQARHGTGSNTIILKLVREDHVWVQLNENSAIMNDYSSFSGHILFED